MVRAAIETLKQANAGSFAGNPDIWIHVINGNVYLETGLEGVEAFDFLDNLFYYLP